MYNQNFPFSFSFSFFVTSLFITSSTLKAIVPCSWDRGFFIIFGIHPFMSEFDM